MNGGFGPTPVLSIEQGKFRHYVGGVLIFLTLYDFQFHQSLAASPWTTTLHYTLESDPRPLDRTI